MMCQSTVQDVRGPVFACSAQASTVLVGVHLCGLHARTWRRRLELGQKIRIHPERSLPLDHVCEPSLSVLSVPSVPSVPALQEATSPPDSPDLPVVPAGVEDEDGPRAEPAIASEAPPPRFGPGPWRRKTLPVCSRTGCTRLAEPRLKWCLECQLEFDERAGRTSADPVGTIPVVYLLELVCMACSRWVDDIPSPTERPSTLLIAPTVRCKVCGGRPTFSGEVTRKFAFSGDADVSRLAS